MEDIFYNKEYTATEDFDLNYTFVSPINGTDTTFVSILDANAVITPVNDSLIDVHAELVGVDSTLYQVHTLATIIIPEVRLDYDEQTGSVDRTYTSEDDVMFGNYIAASGYVTLEVTAADASDILGLLFFVESEDPTTVIPVGTYPINNTGEAGTVYASPGVAVGGGPIQSCFCYTFVEDGDLYYDQNGLYCLVDGTVTVKKVNGKYIKGKYVTFKFNGKTYKAKTNSKGIAKIVIKKKVLKKLKVGKKVKYQAKCGKLVVKKSVKVKR